VPERQEKSQLMGEFLRDAAVLLIVFYPLDAVFQNQFNWNTYLLIALMSGAALYFGMILEGRNDL
jgi:hypothetical protein